MKEFIETYEQHKDDIEFFLEESIKNIGELKKLKNNNFSKLFHIFPSLELVYFINKESSIQTSPNYFKFKTDDKARDKDRKHLISKLDFKDKNITFSTPYISSATRNTCITVSIIENNEIIMLDLRIDILLEKLNLLEINKTFHFITKGFYTFSGFAMLILSVITIGLSLYDFLSYLISSENLPIELIFKPIIALTLSIAIFDLAKTILEQEVFFKSYSKNKKVEIKVLTKFLSTIIIALSIESLIVVFKIALNNYDKLINAFYLLAAISLMIVSLTFLIYFGNKKVK